MARVSTYLNFPGTTEEAFNFYKTVFGTEFEGDITRLGDMPPAEGQPEQSEAEKNMIMHIELPIVAGHILMATDAPDSMGFTLTPGNNMHIMIETDTRAETEKLFPLLAEGGKVDMALTEMPWGDVFGSLIDKYNIRWMFNSPIN